MHQDPSLDIAIDQRRDSNSSIALDGNDLATDCASYSCGFQADGNIGLPAVLTTTFAEAPIAIDAITFFKSVVLVLVCLPLVAASLAVGIRKGRVATQPIYPPYSHCQYDHCSGNSRPTTRGDDKSVVRARMCITALLAPLPTPPHN